MSIHSSITEKKYKKLSIQVSLNGISFCIFDTLQHSVLTVKSIDFATLPKASKVEDHIWKAFLDHKELTKTYDEVVVIHENNLNTFVPSAVFDEQFLGSYLQYNTKIFETDYFVFDEIDNYEINNVYIPYVNINNYLLDQFETFDYKQTNSILVSKLLDVSKNREEKLVFVHFSATKFEIIVVQNQKLLFFNSFDYKTKEDFIYYLLFTAEQLKLNPEHFNMYVLGEISKENELFQIAYKYVRNISLLDVSELQKHNDLSKTENLKHFILLQS